MKLIKKISNALNQHQIFNVPVLVWLLRIETLLCLTIVVRWLYGDLILSNNLKISLPFITVSMENKSPLVMTIPLLMSLALWIRGKASYYFVLGYFYYQIGMYLLAVITIIIESIIPPAAVLFSYLPIETDGLIAALFNSLMVKCWTHEINRRFYMEEAEETSSSKGISVEGVIAMLLITIFPMFMFNSLSQKIAYVGERPEKITGENLEEAFWPKSQRPIDVFTYPDGHKEIAVVTSGHLSTPKEDKDTILVYDLNTKKQKMSYKLKNANLAQFSKDGSSVFVTTWWSDFKEIDNFKEIDIEKQEIKHSAFESNEISKNEDSDNNMIKFSPNKDYFCVLFECVASWIKSIDIWDYERKELIGQEEYQKPKLCTMMGWINEREFIIRETENFKKWDIVAYRIDENRKVSVVEKELVKSIFQDNAATLYDDFIELQHNNFNNENIMLFNHLDKRGNASVNMYILNDNMDKIIKKYTFNNHVLNVLPLSSSRLLVCERLPVVKGNMLFTFFDTNTDKKTSFRTDDSIDDAYCWDGYKWLGDNKLFVGDLSWPFDKHGYIIDFNKLGLEN